MHPARDRLVHHARGNPAHQIVRHAVLALLRVEERRGRERLADGPLGKLDHLDRDDVRMRGGHCRWAVHSDHSVHANQGRRVESAS